MSRKKFRPSVRLSTSRPTSTAVRLVSFFFFLFPATNSPLRGSRVSVSDKNNAYFSRNLSPFPAVFTMWYSRNEISFFKKIKKYWSDGLDVLAGTFTGHWRVHALRNGTIDERLLSIWKISGNWKWSIVAATFIGIKQQIGHASHSIRWKNDFIRKVRKRKDAVMEQTAGSVTIFLPALTPSL